MEKIHPTADNVLIRHATKIAVGTVTALMLLMAIIFWRQNDANDESRAWVAHTYEVIGHTELLFGKIKDLMIGQRGFILTGNEIYLEPYNNALKDGSNPETEQRFH
ncbi:MAG: CHASE3 domain-containing protein [Nitrospira sp.]